MDWLTNLIWHHGKFFGIEWGVWKVFGWLGNGVFFSRFFVQWYATEKLKRVVVPTVAFANEDSQEDGFVGDLHINFLSPN